jgi:hypothetical protein
MDADPLAHALGGGGGPDGDADGAAHRPETNTVHYELFLDAAQRACDAEQLVPWLACVAAAAREAAGDYLWQREPFRLRIDAHEAPPRLSGSTDFGDCVLDEWMVVWLLVELTRRFPQLTARARDEDGEFILIHLADALPSWLEPETSENRVFLRGGELHLLPRPESPADLAWLPPRPSLDVALALLRTRAQRTIAAPRLRAAFTAAVSAQRAAAQEANTHRAVVWLPPSAARVFEAEPRLVTAAADAFYLRDPLDERAARKMRRLLRDGGEGGYTVLRLTRCTFAQLAHQRFRAPAPLAAPEFPTSDPRARAVALGVALSSGLEILLSRASHHQQAPPPPPPPPPRCLASPEAFDDALQACGWFVDCASSEAHQQRRAEARAGFEALRRRGALASVAAIGDDQRPDWATTIDAALSAAPPAKLSADAFALRGDSEAWMEVSEADLRRAFHELRVDTGADGYEGGRERSAETKTDDDEDERENEDEDGEVRLDEMVRRMREFMGAETGFDGAELRDSPQGGVRPSADSILRVLRGGGSGGREADAASEDEKDQEEEEEEERGSREKEARFWDADDSDAEPDGGVAAAAAAMDAELAREGVGARDAERPVRVDLALVDGILRSLAAQHEVVGPAATLLHSIGVAPPRGVVASEHRAERPATRE